MTDLIDAVAYIRNSTPTNVGEDKYGQSRQEQEIDRAAERFGYRIVKRFYEVVTGDLPVDERPEFGAMLDFCDAEGISTVFVESADRYSRKMLVAELGYLLLTSRGIKMLDSRGENLTDTDDEMRVAFRQMAMTFAQLEKTRLVKKLRKARDEKRVKEGRCEGRKPAPEAAQSLARSLVVSGLSLREISAELASAGFLAPSGSAYGPSSVKCMLG